MENEATFMVENKQQSNSWGGDSSYKWLSYYTIFCLFCLVWNLIVPNVLSDFNIELEYLKVFAYSSTFPALYGLIGGIIVLNHVDKSQSKKQSLIAKFLISEWIVGFFSTAAALSVWEGIDYIDSGGPMDPLNAYVGVVIFILFTVIPLLMWMKIQKVGLY